VRGRWILALAIGLPVAAVVAVTVFLISYDGRKDIDLGGWVGTEDSWTRSMMPGARWATDELCGSDVPCMQAVMSETLTMYRFADRDDAVAAAESFGADGYLTGWIAVRYEPGGLSPAEREDFEYGISCINTWVGEAGQDC